MIELGYYGLLRDMFALGALGYFNLRELFLDCLGLLVLALFRQSFHLAF
jgi:hypothetical protein